MERFLEHMLKSSTSSSGESSSIKTVIDTKDGSCIVEVSKTITEQYPVTDIENAMKLFDNLNRGGGRRLWKLSDMT